MMRRHMNAAQKARLDVLGVKLNDLDSRLRYFRARRDLTILERIEMIVCIVKLRWFVERTRRLLKKCEQMTSRVQGTPP
uniref:AsIV-cont00047-ORF1 n=1 Tax=Apophua simplicipes ichnovirus TaxID=1329648 RepID=S5DMJ0_9VIRU|nr:AsIV-cont00047-ORF1 [Apophua simplicipes ichnovirus]